MDIEKEVKKTFRIMVIWSVAAVAAIPLMILSLILLTGWVKWVLAAPLIAVLVASFYGLPIGWTMSYAGKLQKARIVSAVKSGVLKIKDIAAMTGEKEKFLVPNIQELIGKRYLVGYKFNDNKTELEFIEVIARKQRKCPNCGGILDDDGVCRYCNARI
jgi:ribosomal protein S27AE